MIFSFKTLFISIILSTPFILLLHILMKKISDKSIISARLLNIISLLFILRMLLPFEYFYTITLHSKLIYPYLRDLFLTEMPFVNMSVMVFLCMIWTVVSLYKLVKLTTEYLSIKKLLSLSLSADDVMISIPTDYQQYKVRVIPNLKSPCVVGVFNPTVILPNTFFTEKELLYILQHEYLHISRLDLIIKAVYELLVVIYWWNPLMYIFRKQFSQIIELRVDEEIVESFSTDERIEYIQLMLKVQNEQSHSNARSEFALYFTSIPEEPLLQRSMNVLNKQKFHLKFPTLIFVFILGFYLSTSIVIEPYYANAPQLEGTFAITEENGFLVRNPNGSLDLYLNDQFIQTISTDELPIFESLTVYNSLSEVKYEKN